MNGLQQLRDATGGHQVGWKSPTVDDDETANQQRVNTCTEVSGVENIGQCGRLSQFRWLMGAL